MWRTFRLSMAPLKRKGTHTLSTLAPPRRPREMTTLWKENGKWWIAAFDESQKTLKKLSKSIKMVEASPFPYHRVVLRPDVRHHRFQHLHARHIRSVKLPDRIICERRRTWMETMSNLLFLLRPKSFLESFLTNFSEILRFFLRILSKFKGAKKAEKYFV